MVLSADGRELPRVSLSLWLGQGRFEPDEVTARVGITPTIAVRVGDPNPVGVPRRHARWGLRIGPTAELHAEPLFAELYRLLLPSWGLLSAAVREVDLAPRIACVVELRSSVAPSLKVPPTDMNWIVELGAELDIDIALTGPSVGE
jgi:hypothetical protein